MNIQSVKKSITLLFIILFVQNIIFAQNTSKIDSTKHVIASLLDDTLKVNTINDFVWSIKMSNYDDAVKYGISSYELAKNLDYTKGIAYATKNLGAVYYYASDNKNAYDYYKISLDAFKKMNDKKGIAIALKNLGNVSFNIADWKQALDYYLKSLALREEIGDKKGVAAVNDAIGLVYSSYKERDFKTPAEYHRKALKINTELNDQYGIATSYLYLGRNYYTKYRADTTNKNVADSAIMYLNKSRKIFEEQQDIYSIATIDDILGQIYLTKSKYNEAYNAFNNSLNIWKQAGYNFGIISSYIYISSFYSEKNELIKSKKYLEDALKLATEIDSKSQIKEIYGRLSGIEANLKNYKRANELTWMYINLKDSLQNEEKTKEMTQLSMQHDFDKKERLRELEDAKKEAIQAEKDKIDKLIKIALGGGVLLMLIIAINLIRSYRRKVKANNLLQDKNFEITNKNALLNQQKEEIQAQAENLQEAYNEIEEQHRNITDSIAYAQRIQEAALPPSEYFDKILADYFILFKPRDIVSGDYYWAREIGNKTIIIAADCTGHGVPGAFMSLLGISNLNEIVTNLFIEKGENIEAGIILDNLRENIKNDLRQTGKDGESKDGMDMAICIVDKKEMKLQFAGAQNPILIVHDDTLTKYKPDRMPVGIHYGEEKPFKNVIINIEKGDKIYMLSDGYIDQFGGKNGRKFMMKRFYELIAEVASKPMKEQKDIFNNVIEKWEKTPDQNGKTYNQIDDILVIGFEV